MTATSERGASTSVWLSHAARAWLRARTERGERSSVSWEIQKLIDAAMQAEAECQEGAA